MQDRLIGGSEKPEDHIDRAIRPTSLDDYIGQPVFVNKWKSLLAQPVVVVKPSITP